MKAGKNKCYIETTSEDNKLNEILHKSNWETTEERVLLGRSVWKRKNAYKLKSIETEPVSYTHLTLPTILLV